MSAALQTKNDPAATAIAPGLGSINPAKEMKMNVRTNTTAKPTTASTPIDMGQACREVEFLWDEIAAIKHKAHFLMFDLEACFDFNRGIVVDTSVSLQFQKDGVEATLWLVGNLWSSLNKVSEKIGDLTVRMERARQ